MTKDKQIKNDILSSEKKTIPPQKNDEKHVLILGDCFIDENWLMAKSERYHSSNVGESHYLSMLKKAKSAILSLCGAASIARMLNAPHLRDSFQIYMGGAWNPLDDEILKCVLCNKDEGAKHITPYFLKSFNFPENPGIKNNNKKCLYGQEMCSFKPKVENLIRDLTQEEFEEGKLDYTELVSTNRLIRVYEGFGTDQPQLRYRYDWELDLPERCKDHSKLDKFFKEGKIKNIVLVDHGKGLIDKDLVNYLLDKTRNHNPPPKFFIRTKMALPDWLVEFRKQEREIHLLFVDFHLIEYKYGPRQWILEKTILGRSALEILGEFLGLHRYEHQTRIESEYPLSNNIAVIFREDAFIAASLDKSNSSDKANDRTKYDAFLSNLVTPPGKEMPIRVGRSSTFFASLIYWDLMYGEDINGRTIDKACRWALQNAYNWTLGCSKAWIASDPSKLSGSFENAIPLIEQKYKDDSTGNTKVSTLNKSWDKWNASSKDLGIVEEDEGDIKDKQIQLWRGYGTLDKYICVGGEKRSSINELLRLLDEYNGFTSPGYPFNCLFQAEPGWGKSYLASCISKHFNYEFLNYSIAQMGTSRDLLDCFIEIVSTQNRTGKKALIFMDEIDAQIQGNSAIDLLLGPIWDGKFRVGSNTFKILPCVWAFASTSASGTIRNLPKGRDFLSRINGPILDLDYHNKDSRKKIDETGDYEKKTLLSQETFINNENIRTELIYHGVNLLNKYFGPITHIDKKVLEVFFDIMPHDGIRSLDIFVSKFKGIEKGRVLLKNLPNNKDHPELDNHFKYIAKRNTDKNQSSEPELIKVITKPSSDC